MSFVSSQGSASQELAKLCSLSGSSLDFINSRAISENRVKGLYRVLNQKATLRAVRALWRTFRHSPFRSIAGLSWSVMTPLHSWQMYCAASARSPSLRPSSLPGQRICANFSSIYFPQCGQGTKKCFSMSQASFAFQMWPVFSVGVLQI